jgi:hypothetical protein
MQITVLLHVRFAFWEIVGVVYTLAVFKSEVMLYISRVGNPVANRHKWRIGHESVATRLTFLQLVRRKNCQISH